MGRLDDIAAKWDNQPDEQGNKPLGRLDSIAAKFEDRPQPETDSNIFSEEGTLKKADLKKGRNANTIRTYMIDRFGQDYTRDVHRLYFPLQ